MTVKMNAVLIPQQHAVGGLQRTHHQPVRLQHHARGASRDHRVDRVEDRNSRRSERAKPQIRRRPDRRFDPV